MDGSGRVTLRNRKYLRKIEPFFRRHVSFDNVLAGKSNEERSNSTIGNPVINTDEDENSTGVLDYGIRRSSRIRKAPKRYEAKW